MDRIVPVLNTADGILVFLLLSRVRMRRGPHMEEVRGHDDAWTQVDDRSEVCSAVAGKHQGVARQFLTRGVRLGGSTGTAGRIALRTGANLGNFYPSRGFRRASSLVPIHSSRRNTGFVV